MKLLHLSDLHLGKRVNGFSMLEDQRVILTQIVDLRKRRSMPFFWRGICTISPFRLPRR